MISRIFTIEGEADQLVETNIDLSEGLNGDTGHPRRDRGLSAQPAVEASASQ
ncbi:MAG: hypothetical protein HC802_02875 [Caldilineaceae bacterium]|nr:hypothetical protein [Caldilineaceae bacterium]